MPYSSHTHFTALGGSILLFGFTPNCSRCELFSLSQRQKVVRLTPAASARSDLYMLFIVLIFLQIYEKILAFASLLLFIFSDCFSTFQRLGKMSYLCNVMKTTHVKVAFRTLEVRLGARASKNFTREALARHQSSLRITHVTIANVTLDNRKRNTIQSQSQHYEL